jgi:hypothetical protein
MPADAPRVDHMVGKLPMSIYSPDIYEHESAIWSAGNFVWLCSQPLQAWYLHTLLATPDVQISGGNIFAQLSPTIYVSCRKKKKSRSIP